MKGLLPEETGIEVKERSPEESGTEMKGLLPEEPGAGVKERSPEESGMGEKRLPTDEPGEKARELTEEKRREREEQEKLRAIQAARIATEQLLKNQSLQGKSHHGKKR